LIHKDVARDNALYRFTVEDINIAHMGDVGNPLSERQLDALSGIDVLLALAGGPPTIELEDLEDVLNAIKPKVVIPMHFRIPGPKFSMLPVSAFTDRYPPERVQRFATSEIELNRGTLPDDMQIYVLEPAIGPR
jgi:L-ascorbate metabolism protein UlaG (beta-lactamase superfamily)